MLVSKLWSNDWVSAVAFFGFKGWVVGVDELEIDFEGYRDLNSSVSQPAPMDNLKLTRLMEL